MDDHVRDSYDGLAELYTSLALGPYGDLNREAAYVLDWLAAFAQLAAEHDGVVADLGCGPGHIVNHLSELGLTAVGYDLSPGLIAQGHQAFPGAELSVADITALDIDKGSLGGIVTRYSLIHMTPDRLGAIFASWLPLLKPGAPILVSFFAERSAEAHGTPFDHKVATAYAFFTDTIADELRDAGFDRIETDQRGPREGERDLDHGTVLARRPG